MVPSFCPECLPLPPQIFRDGFSPVWDSKCPPPARLYLGICGPQGRETEPTFLLEISFWSSLPTSTSFTPLHPQTAETLDWPGEGEADPQASPDCA